MQNAMETDANINAKYAKSIYDPFQNWETETLSWEVSGYYASVG